MDKNLKLAMRLIDIVQYQTRTEIEESSENFKERYNDLVLEIETEHGNGLHYLKQLKEQGDLSFNIAEQEGYIRAMRYLLSIVKEAKP
jgi:hypothetical protein